MLNLLRTTLTRHAKYGAVGLAAFVLAGGTATTISLSGNSTPAPSPKSTHATSPEDSEATEPAEVEEIETEGTETGVRPTDTHGYCVSHAVAAAKAAGKTGRDIGAAARSCPKPNQAAKADKASKGKSATKGKSTTAPGRTRTP